MLQRANLFKLFKSLDELRKIDPHMPTQMAVTFIYVAMNPGCSFGKLEKDCGYSQASSSRNIAALGKYHRAGRPGHDLVRPELDYDSNDLRKKILRLTPKGKRVAETLSLLMD